MKLIIEKHETKPEWYLLKYGKTVKAAGSLEHCEGWRNRLLAPKLPKAGKHRLVQLAKLDALAAQPGTPDEGKRAGDMAAAIRAKYDCTPPKQANGDIFAGAFHRQASATTPIAKIPDIHIENAVKWAIEERTKIPCVTKDGCLCAAATNGTAVKLGKIAGTIAESFAACWKEFAGASGVLPADSSLFYRGLYDGMMNDQRQDGEALPPRRIEPLKGRKKKTLGHAAGLRLHPYSAAIELGRLIRFSAPLPEVVNQLRGMIAGALGAGTP